MSGFQPRKYQQSVLDSTRKYFEQCHAFGSPGVAFTATTEALWGRGLPYNRIDGIAPAASLSRSARCASSRCSKCCISAPLDW